MKTVAMLVYDDIGPFQLAGPLMVFSGAKKCGAALRLLVCTVEQGAVQTSVGSFFGIPAGLDELAQADAVIVPGWYRAEDPVPDALIQALRMACTRGAQIMGVCLGMIVLERAGLLRGKRVTTLWVNHDQLADCFADAYPDDHIPYTHDQNIWTSAGGALVIDACLQLVQVLSGMQVADAVSLALVRRSLQVETADPRATRNSSYRDGNRRLQELLSWLSAHPDDAQSLDCLAARANMTVRTFTRRFKALTGTTVVQWRLALRLRHARRLLKETDATVETVAEQVGFPLATSLRRHFRRCYGLSPSAYRRKVRRSQ